MQSIDCLRAVLVKVMLLKLYLKTREKISQYYSLVNFKKLYIIYFLPNFLKKQNSVAHPQVVSPLSSLWLSRSLNPWGQHLQALYTGAARRWLIGPSKTVQDDSSLFLLTTNKTRRTTIPYQRRHDQLLSVPARTHTIKLVSCRRSARRVGRWSVFVLCHCTEIWLIDSLVFGPFKISSWIKCAICSFLRWVSFFNLQFGQEFDKESFLLC